MTDATRDSITIMITKGRVVATKRITLRPGAVKPEIQEYDRAKHFSIREVPAGNIYEFALLLREIEKRPDVFIVRGKPASGVDRNHTLRRLHPRTNPDGTVTPRTGLDFDDLDPLERHRPNFCAISFKPSKHRLNIAVYGRKYLQRLAAGNQGASARQRLRSQSDWGNTRSSTGAQMMYPAATWIC